MHGLLLCFWLIYYIQLLSPLSISKFTCLVSVLFICLLVLYMCWGCFCVVCLLLAVLHLCLCSAVVSIFTCIYHCVMSPCTVVLQVWEPPPGMWKAVVRHLIQRSLRSLPSCYRERTVKKVNSYWDRQPRGSGRNSMSSRNQSVLMQIFGHTYR